MNLRPQAYREEARAHSLDALLWFGQQLSNSFDSHSWKHADVPGVCYKPIGPTKGRRAPIDRLMPMTSHFCIGLRPLALAASFGVVNAVGHRRSGPVGFMPMKRPDLTIYVTGFGPFMGVEQNPTSTLCDTLKKYVQQGVVPEGVDKEILKEFDEAGIALEGLKVLEVAAEPCRSEVPEIVKYLKEQKAERQGEAVILHLGVASNRNAISLECRGVNEATFRVPDQRGYQCCGEEVVVDSSPVMFCSLHLPKILAELHDRGVKCEMSTDAGRFLCNYVFFQSLHAAKPFDIPVLFVHVPPFEGMDHAAQVWDKPSEPLDQ